MRLKAKSPSIPLPLLLLESALAFHTRRTLRACIHAHSALTANRPVPSVVGVVDWSVIGQRLESDGPLVNVHWIETVQELTDGVLFKRETFAKKLLPRLPAWSVC